MPDGVNDILDDLEDAAEDDRVSVGDITEAFGNRGAAPFLIVPAILEISPIGGIPGVPTVLAVIAALFAVQIAWGRKSPKIPGILARREVDADRLRTSVDRMRPLADRLDGWFHGRLERFTTDRMQRAAMWIVIALCAMVPPLELLPFASTLPMAAILLFGLALLFHDGLVMVLAFAVSVAAILGAGWLALS